MYSGNHTRVRLTRDIDLQPYTTLRRGEQGTVVASEFEHGGWTWIEVQMDKEHEGLTMWRNVAHIADPDINAVEVLKKQEPCFSSAKRSHLAIVASLVIFATVGVMVVAFPMKTARAFVAVEETLGRHHETWSDYEQWRTQWSATRKSLKTTETLLSGY